jgi:predicted 2-oxoglutarate/Fe(II)-dependent dioxygenase YbiX
MPRLKKLNQGSIEFSLEGGRLTNEKKIFPTKLVDLKKGDFILFPSSLFHSTVPIESNEERITLAFDVRPK